MKSSNIIRILLAIIVCAAFFIRAYQVGINPPAISWDEASIGYNAYTLLTYARDEHGRFLPFDTFAAFGDYKPPVAIYLTVPFIAVFGLNEFAVRIPSVLAGTVTVWLFYLLAQELFRKSSKRESVGLIGSALLAITPWHVMLSRAGFEANIACMIVTAGVVLSLKALRDSRYLYVAWLPFIVGMYTFNSARYAGPALAFPLFIAALRTYGITRKELVRGVVIAVLCLLPLVPHLLSRESRLRFEEVSIFTDLRTVLTSNSRRGVDGNTAWSGIIHNRRIGYAREYLVHFLDNLEPRFLFIKGDGNPKFSIQDTGQLLIVSMPFFVYGLLMLFSEVPVSGWLLVWWLVTAIAPTAVARETPHALRIENALPFFIFASAYGLVSFHAAFKSRPVRNAVALGLLTMFIGNFMFFWHNLMTHYPKEYSGEWQYGYKQAIELAMREKAHYDTIVLTESIGRPYIYALFYEKYDLKKFEKTKDASFDSAGFYNVYGFDKYRFTNKGVGNYTGKTLYILPPKDVPKTATLKETISVLNGTPILVAFE